MEAPAIPTDAATIAQVIAHATRALREAGFDTARLDADLLAMHALGLTRVQLLTRGGEAIAADARDALAELVARRLAHEPVQYITGRAYFRNLELAVDARVLIPRPETELLVEWAVEEVAALRVPTPTTDPSNVVRVLDVCTGSGAIAIAIGDEAPPATVQVCATDISPDALEVARVNAARCGVDVDLHCGDLYAPVAGMRFDVVVSNPPYVARTDEATLPASVRDHEPHVALFGSGDDGTGIVERVIDGARGVLAPGGLLAIEIGMGQHGHVSSLLGRAGFADVEQRRDLQGIVRAVGGRMPASSTGGDQC